MNVVKRGNIKLPNDIEQQFLNSLSVGQLITGRTGVHTSGTSPRWQDWSEYEVFYVQEHKGRTTILDLEGIEIVVENLEYYVDENDHITIVAQIENTIMELIPPTEFQDQINKPNR